ncbi:hypothetical protein SLEP1_g2491 [Rubroshorea leprosula]|uniref:Glycosyl transferase CAP10 domain-containing protein n=1 Tax=Rubroshorea leprosula TaxID=152421 RepID=A0AAV5HNX7_9ROSI|nr:hypothetical protein SLEP1_g2491 [Rubroshorea leprosula]
MGEAEGTAALAPRNTYRRIGICSRRHQEFIVLVSKYLILTLTRWAVEEPAGGKHVVRCRSAPLEKRRGKERGESREPLAISSELLRWYPGRLPDLDLMFECGDHPRLQSGHFQGPNAQPPPLFRYCSQEGNLDIVFPDWTFWGWAETNIRPWRNLLKDIKEGSKRIKWKDRVPYAYYRGNLNVAPTRKDLKKCNPSSEHDWNTRLYMQDWKKESRQGFKNSNLVDQCTHRYKIYIEGQAWSRVAAIAALLAHQRRCQVPLS